MKAKGVRPGSSLQITAGTHSCNSNDSVREDQVGDCQCKTHRQANTEVETQSVSTAVAVQQPMISACRGDPPGVLVGELGRVVICVNVVHAGTTGSSKLAGGDQRVGELQPTTPT